jgi:hypothetical protein
MPEKDPSEGLFLSDPVVMIEHTFEMPVRLLSPLERNSLPMTP